MRPARPLVALIAVGLFSACGGDRTGPAAPVDGGADAGGDAPAACGAGVAPGPGLTVTDRGAVQGVAAGEAWAYLGLPYAAPPVGSLRWAAPAPVAECWSGVRDASAFGPKCPQLDASGAVIGEEDCLSLNVWTPAGATAGEGLPVLFFVHGGGHVQGSAADQAASGEYIYDGAALAAAAQVVVVTINYRLGALGFVSAPALSAADPQGVSGNYGVRDAIAALGWVQRNAAAFGGDPGRVLLFGESAGAVQTCSVLVSPLAAGLFRAALMESGGCAAKDQAGAEAFGAQVIAAAGCADAADVLACMRGLAADAVVAALPQPVDVAGKQGGYQPNIDGTVIPGVPLALLAAGAHNHVPLVVGVNADETSRYVPQMTVAEYQQAVYALVGGNTAVGDVILAQYPVADYAGVPRRAFVALTSDAKFICTARKVARAARAGQTEPVYRYYFTHPFQNAGATALALGAWHGIELTYVFDHLHLAGYTPTAGEQALADVIGGSWSRLAATGDPNGGGAPAWPEYVAATDPFLQLEDPSASGAGVRTAPCDFWDTIMP
ncbi:MAG TPA: carboxylesterase family protein [Polyangia bacterium]|jgi:para-nitrobenzyl esterase